MTAPTPSNVLAQSHASTPAGELATAAGHAAIVRPFPGRAEVADAGDGWELPVPLARPSAPPFPTHVFPSWLADMVTGVAEFTQTDPAMAGTIALAVLATCAGGRLEVEVRPGWRVPTNLFLAVIAEPGERKSPVHTAMTGPLMEAERSLAQRFEPLIAENTALRDIAERNAEQAKAIAAKAEPGRREELSADAVAAALEAEAITVPSVPRLLADDATAEKLASLMADNHGRIAVISDEGGIFDILAGRYSSSTYLDPYLKGHAGTPMRVDRRGREEFIANPALTVGVMAQPSVLRKFGSNEALRGCGLLARFLFVLPASFTGWRTFRSPTVSDTVRATYDATIHDLATTLAEWTEPAVVALTPEAEDALEDADAAIERELRPGGELASIKDWANKLTGTTARLAGCLHLAHHPHDGWHTPIDADRIRDAAVLARFFLAHFRIATHAISTDTSVEHAAFVLRLLVDRQLTSFTRRELHRRVQRHLPKAEQVAAVLDVLVQLGWIRHNPIAERFELHPHAADHANPGDTVTTRPTEGLFPGHGLETAVTGPDDRR